MKKEKGFVYKKLKSKNLKVLEVFHSFAIDQGWERVGDVHTDFWGTYAQCWYRKPINIL